LRGGTHALLDHEIVEYLLALVIARCDTKSRAKRLLNELGGIGGLFAAGAEGIERAGFSETAVASLKIVNAAAVRLLAAEIKARWILNSWNALLDYLRADLAHPASSTSACRF
jgi:DNA repair protein RadC